MIRAVYFHAIDGRLRIHVAEVKGSPVKAMELTDRLGCYSGVNTVKANPVTGNILITYNSNRISQWEVLGKLREMGYLEERQYVSQNLAAQAAGSSDWSTALVRVGLEALLSALIL